MLYSEKKEEKDSISYAIVYPPTIILTLKRILCLKYSRVWCVGQYHQRIYTMDFIADSDFLICKCEILFVLGELYFGPDMF